MKIWLNKMLLCPDDKTYPLNLSIFSWDTNKEKFSKLLNAYNASYLLNFRDPKKERTIQLYNGALMDSEEELADPIVVHKENQKISVDFDYKNIISIFLEKGTIVIKDYNIVRPTSISSYLAQYIDWFDEFDVIKDVSENEAAIQVLELIKNQVIPDIKQFQEQWNDKDIADFDKKDEVEICQQIVDELKPIFQHLLLINYFLFAMEINSGLLVCPECNRWYPIIQTIPRLFPKSMKRTELDIDFKDKWEEKFPKKVI